MADAAVNNSKKAERLNKLRQLHSKRTAASNSNHKEVVEEYKRLQLPTNWAKRKEWADKKLTEEQARQKAAEEGVDFDRQKFLTIQADEAERWERKKMMKRNEDPGFSGYDDAAARAYTRNVKNLKPDMEEYEEMKEKVGEEAFYASKEDEKYGKHKDAKRNVDRLVQDVTKQIERREKFSRRRTHDDDADVDYINERNMKFNKKLERFYSQYTSDIKQNLERGTAI